MTYNVFDGTLYLALSIYVHCIVQTARIIGELYLTTATVTVFQC